MRNIRFIIIAFGLIILPEIAWASGSSQRLIISNSRLWKLSENDWSLSEMTSDFGAVLDTRRTISADFHASTASPGLKYLGIEVSGSPYKEVLIYDYTRAVLKRRFIGKCPGFGWSKGLVGFLGIDPKTVESAFYVATINDGNARVVVTGGFYEHYPVVASSRFFYVFRSGENKTLRINMESGVVDEPAFLNQRVVLAVMNDERFLIEDRTTEVTSVIDSSGNTVCALNVGRRFWGIEFSRDGRYVYLSILGYGIAENYDFAIYDMLSAKVRYIRRGFWVSRGQVSRSAEMNP